MKSALREAFAPNRVSPDYARRTGIALALRPRAFLANAGGPAQVESPVGATAKSYTPIARPLLLISGEEDAVAPAWNHAERLIRQVPRAQLVYLGQTGDAPHHSRPASQPKCGGGSSHRGIC